MHKVAEPVQAAVNIPLLHIADATATVLLENKIQRVGLLGTAFTMEQDFYKGRLMDKYDLEVLVPEENDSRQVHDVIYNELCLGTINLQSKQTYIKIVDRLAEKGAQAVILGCTEIGLLSGQADTAVPLYDTARIHAAEAVAWALA